MKWMRIAANNGDVTAMKFMGDYYDDEENPVEASKYYLKAAKQGEASAQYNLGIYYFFGRGIEKNKEEAMKWLRNAAKQGNPKAIDFLNSYSQY